MFQIQPNLAAYTPARRNGQPDADDPAKVPIPATRERERMVHRQENKDNTLPQFRDEEEPRVVGRLPHVGETIGRKEPPYNAVGLAALSPLLAKVAFPVTKGELIARIGQAVVPVSRWRTTSIAEIIERTGPSSFASEHELTSAIDRVWDTIAPEDVGGRGGHHHRR